VNTQKPKRIMDTSKLTVVFEVKDRDAMAQLYEAHMSGSTIYGLAPSKIAWGDQLTTPSELLDGLINLDPEFHKKRDLKSLCERAEKHRRE